VTELHPSTGSGESLRKARDREGYLCFQQDCLWFLDYLNILRYLMNCTWQVIQNRGDYGEPRVNFTASWQDYKEGFGELQVVFNIVHTT
jgi:hypothetical protein